MKELLAKWQSRGKAHFIELYVDIPDGVGDNNGLPVFSYTGNGCGGVIGRAAPEVAMQYAAQQASYAPSKMPRVFYDEALAARCCDRWGGEVKL